jgi:hypothetical protein
VSYRPIALVSLLLVLVAAGCRDDADGNTPDMTIDMAAPVVLDCAAQSDCLTCCLAEHQSGALDFDSQLQSCACQPSTCQAACQTTICGSEVGIEPACRTCLEANDGGVCAPAVTTCVETDGACGAFKRCVDRCP